MRRVPRALAGVTAGLLGGGALFVVGTVLREALRVPTLPEVLAEWATFYIPFQLFEFMINNFRTGAKLMLFWGIMALLALVASGVGILYARRPTLRLAVGLVVGLWGFTLLVVLPSSGMGFFGSDVRAGPLAVTAAYLLAWAAFGVVLSLVYWLLVPRSRPRLARRDTEASGAPLIREVPR